MSAPWPPPPDLESIQQLVREADIEGHLAEGAPADEYEPEEEDLYAAISTWPTAQLTASSLQPIIEEIWRKSFNLNDSGIATRSTSIAALAAQIERFFGPEAKPQVR
ncbi:hypothetical protein GOB94_02900 [Granulicella sp. 5B5]|uniref:hypothetical protein n=1 Tax=Granulicella sp. 5B5 TaxID=1617967 RepID=UPI0015F371C4|nr:hypothetical protein [Granulicella sp. 5B5]QMV17762.1 hypothetical protein GOB94_02900 [Granulicella sp. 5B5]